MRAHLWTARAVASLFIIATAAAIVGGSLLLPLTEPDYLGAVSAAEGQIATGALIELVLVLSVVGIAVLIYPVLRRRNEGLAIAYVGSRILEGVLLMAAAMSALVILGLSRSDGSHDTAAVVLETRDWTYLVGSTAALGVSALILYGVLFRARLVPAWLSLWGLVGGALILLEGVVLTYGADLSGTVQAVVAAPIGLNEMVLAVWLIVRGFDERGLAAVPQPAGESGAPRPTSRTAGGVRAPAGG